MLTEEKNLIHQCCFSFKQDDQEDQHELQWCRYVGSPVAVIEMTNQIPRDFLHIRSCTPYTIQCTSQIQKFANTEIQIQPLIWLFKTPGLHCTSDAVQKMSLHFRRVAKCNIVLSIIWTVYAVYGCSEFIEDCAVLSFRQYVPVCSCSAVCSFRCQMFFPEGRVPLVPPTTYSLITGRSELALIHFSSHNI